MDVNVVRIRPNNWTILLVHFLNFPDVLVASEDVIVCFPPVGCFFATVEPGNLAKRGVEINAIYDQS